MSVAVSSVLFIDARQRKYSMKYMIRNTMPHALYKMSLCRKIGNGKEVLLMDRDESSSKVIEFQRAWREQKKVNVDSLNTLFS